MPENLMTSFPHALNHLEAVKFPLRTVEKAIDDNIRALSLGQDMVNSMNDLSLGLTRQALALSGGGVGNPFCALAAAHHLNARRLINVFNDFFVGGLKRLQQEKCGELSFLDLFTGGNTVQDWSVNYDDSNILLDLPSLRVIDISGNAAHALANYTVVFAPRAGHHSNIAERVALYLRDQGLTRMAVVEQKCADDIPLVVGGKRHTENFDSQVAQYRAVLAHLSESTGHPPHLVAVCQPGPLLISTLILNPQLGKTFGSAGSPMHTEAQSGFLTDFSRLMGEKFIDRLIDVFGRTMGDRQSGDSREVYDGALQVLGFYFLGMDQHVRNLKKLLADLKQGNNEAAERQATFYNWYNSVHHFPAGFIRDTYKQIFVKNALIRGDLSIGGRTIGIADYPGSVPIWALGGENDDIAPPLQATGHLALIDAVPRQKKLNLICGGGHMGLFRSKTILKTHYSKIARFMLAHSDH